MEAWAAEQFENVAEKADNEFELVHVEVGRRLDLFDVVLQFKRQNSHYISANVDVKATSQDIVNSGKSPNITSYTRIRNEYIDDPDYIFIILSLKHKVYGEKDPETGMTNGIMEIVSSTAYDLKHISATDISFNPALGTGQIQIRDIHSVSVEQRTTWEFVQLLDQKFIRSRGKMSGWNSLASMDGLRNKVKMQNTIICGDAVEVMQKMLAQSVDLIVADPPYNLGKDYGISQDKKNWQEYEEFIIQWLDESVRVLKPSGSLFVFMGVRFIAKLYLLLEERYALRFNGWISWHYTQGMGRKVGFSPRHEDILYFTKSDSYTFNLDAVRIPQKYYRERNNMAGANPGDVWEFSHVHYCSTERQKHPTQKPEALIERIVKASSNPGDVVLDPFVGSGTTCRVAQVLGRKWIGIDINAEYVEMTRLRLFEEPAEFDSYDPRLHRTPRHLPSNASEAQLLLGVEGSL